MNGLRVGTALFLLLSSASATAEPDRDVGARPRGTYVRVSREHSPVVPMFGRGPTVLFLNRSGGTYDGAWWDDSSSNESSILQYSVQMPEYPYGDRSWNEVLDCVREMYAAFDVEVTDVDPGQATHIEVVVSGHPNDIGLGGGVGGIAPMACEPIPNAVAYAFPETYGDDPQGICEAAAQESAHAFGLDHEVLCEDVMTYLWGCGRKRFVDEDAPCGEYNERGCACGGNTQNSYQYLLSALGPAVDRNEAPSVSIESPDDGAEVEPGFTIELTAFDDVGVDTIDLVIDGENVEYDDDEPWAFSAPDDLPAGEHEIEVKAWDDAGATATDTITVTVVPGADEDPEDGPDVDPEGGLGQLGDPCDDGKSCASNACVGADDYCTEACEDGSCPEGYLCTGTPQGEYCLRVAEEKRDRGGCAIAEGRPPSAGSLAAIALAMLGLFWALRRAAW